MKRPRVSLRTMFLTVIAIAVWMAVVASHQHGQALERRVRIADWQEESDWHSRNWTPDDPSQLQVGPKFGYEHTSYSGAGERWIHVPDGMPCRVCVCYRNIEAPDSIVKRVPDTSAPLTPGTHILRWDSMLSEDGKLIHHGVLVDDQWLIRGQLKLDAAHRLSGFYDTNVQPNELIRLFYGETTHPIFESETQPGLAVWIEQVPDQ